MSLGNRWSSDFGRPWARYVEEEVFGRADMTASRAYRPQNGDGTVATVYYQEETGGEWLPKTDLLVGWGTSAGGNAATAEDLVVFATNGRPAQGIARACGWPRFLIDTSIAMRRSWYTRAYTLP